MQYSVKRKAATSSRITYDENIWRMIAFALWIGILSASFFLYTEENPDDPYVRQPVVLYMQVVALLGFFCVAGAAAGFRRLLSAFTRLDRLNGQSLITWFFIYVIIFSPFAKAPATAFVYGVLTWMAFAMSAVAWPRGSAAITAAFSLTTCVLLFVLIGVLFQFGYHGSRYIGGNNPNALGQLAFVLAVCGLPGHPRLQTLGVVVGAVFIFLVDSRSSGLALVVFLLLFLLIPPYGRYLPNLLQRSGAVLGLIAATAVLWELLQYSAPMQSVIHWLRLYDPSSGIGSGLTGRTEQWSRAMTEIQAQPFFGHGFRIDFSWGGHSGYLNLIGETGIVGALLLLTAIGWLLVVHLNNATNRAQASHERRLSKVIVSFLGANLLVLWVVEPMYISLGFPTQAALIYFLAKPIAAATPSRRRRSKGRRSKSRRSEPEHEDFRSSLAGALRDRDNSSPPSAP